MPRRRRWNWLELARWPEAGATPSTTGAEEVAQDLPALGFQHATGQLENTARLKAVKSDIARMYTVLRERELGISQEPAATESKEK